jgi:hypothetical protein
METLQIAGINETRIELVDVPPPRPTVTLSLLVEDAATSGGSTATTAPLILAVLVVIAVMQRSIWLLIPLFYAFRFPLNLLP